MEDQLISEIEELGIYKEEDECEEPVVLGFIENPKHKWSLLRHFFPSKAWRCSGNYFPQFNCFVIQREYKCV